MTNDSPYDAREQEARDEDRRQALADEADDAFNERRQFGTEESMVAFGDAIADAMADDPELRAALIATGAVKLIPADCAGDDGYDLSD